MKAVTVSADAHETSVREVPDPVLGDGEVMLKIEACCVCGTDLRTYRHGDKKITPPRILGHEFCATVVDSRAGEESGVGAGESAPEKMLTTTISTTARITPAAARARAAPGLTRQPWARRQPRRERALR
jgi:D-arabinose 1-dehydrogenase-like Zn-dependent alcohol dehydrogenase